MMMKNDKPFREYRNNDNKRFKSRAKQGRRKAREAKRNYDS